jgi:hypothetical protein
MEIKGTFTVPVAGAFVHGCAVGDPGVGYTWLGQERSKNVTLSDNRVPPAREK